MFAGVGGGKGEAPGGGALLADDPVGGVEELVDGDEDVQAVVRLELARLDVEFFGLVVP